MSSSKKSPSKLFALPCPPTPSIELVNRYQILGTIPRPNFSSVLASTPAPVKHVPVKQVPAAPAAPPAAPTLSYSMAKLDCPSSSSRPNKPKSSKSKSKTPEFIQDNTELLRVANLLLAQVQAQAQSAVNEESASSNSSTAQLAQSESPDPYGSLAQDAQDPFA
ncbi:hypothetical protein Acr_05g0011660 [Actinidia rufa]|uniref:Uncharacterized protein n=1 Tax=Actinidia rufa TaxID=165716 RepID=A0A7J0EPP3_9ERIC|nr:hypothetical protein Acr_05g0011660 [Actinidia rufa]